MAVSKVILGDETLVDLTSDTVSSDTLLEGATAHAANGEQITGGVVVTPMYTGTKAAIEEAIALGQIPEDAVVNITDDEETSSFQTQINEINNSLSQVKTYVGEDGKLHFVDSAGADTVLPFSGGGDMTAVVTFTSNPTGAAGYTTIYKGENQLQSFSFTYGTNLQIALGLLKFTYNGSTGTITAVHECTVNDKKYSANETVATMNDYGTFKDYTFTVKL